MSLMSKISKDKGPKRMQVIEQRLLPPAQREGDRSGIKPVDHSGLSTPKVKRISRKSWFEACYTKHRLHITV